MSRPFIILIVAALAWAGYASIYTVHMTQQAIVLEFGNPKVQVNDAGLHFKRPWQNVIFLDKRILNLDLPVQEVIASDQKRLVVDAFARFRIINPLLTYQTSTNEVGAGRRLQTLLSSNLRSVLGEQEFVTLLSGARSDLMLQIREAVNNDAATFGIEIVDVRIKRADLPEANSQAIYRRMNTEREREAREARAQGQEAALKIMAQADRTVTVTLANADRDAAILRGEGDGAAVKIFADAYGKDPDFFEFYRSMQAYRISMRKENTTMVLSPDSEFFKYFNLSGKKN
jgi:membrane protease subunit HflC